MAKKIIFFDIDDTLTNLSDYNRLHLLDCVCSSNTIIGIATASQRPLFLMREDEYWMPNNMICNLDLYHNSTINTDLLTGGIIIPFPSFGNSERKFGYKKGYQIDIVSKNFSIIPENVHLFDNDINVLLGVKEKYPKFNCHLVNNDKHLLQLSNSRVKNIYSSTTFG